MRDASLERTSYGSLLDSPAFGALRERGTTRRPTIPRQGSGRRVSSRLSVTRTVTAEGHPPSWSEPGFSQGRLYGREANRYMLGVRLVPRSARNLRPFDRTRR